MHLLLQHPTPPTIRDAFFTDPKTVKDDELVALLLGQGTRLPAPRNQPKKSLSALELTHALLEAAGGRLTHLITCLHQDALDFKQFGLGARLGSRLLAAAELAYRYARGLHRGGNPKIRQTGDLPTILLGRKTRLTEGELLAVLIDPFPDCETTTRLLATYERPVELIETVGPEEFEPAAKDSRFDLRHHVSGAKFRRSWCCRLASAVEIARRCRKREPFGLETLEPEGLGFTSPDLLVLLDPKSPLDAELRAELLETLRSHPDRERDFEQLETIAREAQTKDYARAIELRAMWEALVRRRKWQHPREILGDPVPYPELLSIARARIESGTRPKGRIRRIHKLLQQAELEATREPIAAFVAVLLDLGLSDSAAEETFEHAKRRYLEGRRQVGSPEQTAT